MLKKLTVVFTPEERDALERLADIEVRPVKEQVRASVREAAAARGLWPVAEGQPIAKLEAVQP